MTPDEILKVDAARNHPPGTTVEDLRGQINKQIMRGGHVVKEGNVLLVFRGASPGVVVFHPFNAGTSYDLIKAVKALIAMLKKAGAKTLRTYYTNPAVSTLFESAAQQFDISITKQNGAFVADVRL